MSSAPRRGDGIWGWIGRNEKQIKILFTLIAALYIVWEYRQAVYHSRVERAISYVHDYDQGKILEIREHLSDFWLSKPMTNFLQQQRGLDGDKRVKRYDEELPSLVQSSGSLNDAYNLLNFYRDLSLCVKVSDCDRDTVCNYFFEDVQGFRENYRPLLPEWSQNFGEHAAEIVGVLAEKECVSQFRSYCKRVPTSTYCS
jgi:hypothetical protein